MGWNIKISSGGEECPCGKGKFERFSRYDEDKKDGLHLHFDVCNVCGFETYAHNDYSVKVNRYQEWKDDKGH